MELHIGLFIKEIADKKKIGPTELGNGIQSSKQNVYGIFKRKSIDTNLLAKISKVLEHDFFREYSNGLGIQSSEEMNKEGGESQLVEALRAENEELKAENKKLLTEMVDLFKRLNAKNEEGD